MNLQHVSNYRVNVAFSENSYAMIHGISTHEADAETCAIVCGGYHLGPVHDESREQRSIWIRNNLGAESADNFNLSIPKSENAFSVSSQGNVDVFAWVDLTSDAEYANFLHWIDCSKIKRFFIVAPTPLSNGVTAHTATRPSLAALRGNAKPVDPRQLEVFVSLWNTLKQENAAFRLFDNAGEFRSLPIDEFDDVLVGAARHAWRPIADIVLRAMTACWSSGRSIPGDLFFFRRLVWLAENARLAFRGDSRHSHTLELRTYAT